MKKPCKNKAPKSEYTPPLREYAFWRPQINSTQIKVFNAFTSAMARQLLSVALSNRWIPKYQVWGAVSGYRFLKVLAFLQRFFRCFFFFVFFIFKRSLKVKLCAKLIQSDDRVDRLTSSSQYISSEGQKNSLRKEKRTWDDVTKLKNEC